MPYESGRITPVLLAKELGIRPQLIYGLIRQKRIHAYGSKPQMVDVEEVKMVLKNVHHREPKEVKEGRKASLRRGTITSYDRRAGGRKGGREIAAVMGTYKSEDPDGIDYVYMHSGRRETVPWEAATLGDRLAKGLATIENPKALFGMLIWQMQQNGETDKANALDEFLRQVLELEPLNFSHIAEQYTHLSAE